MALTSGKYTIPNGAVVNEKQPMKSSLYGESDFTSVYKVPSGEDLQAIIDDVSAPSHIYLSAGTYSGELDITRPMSIIGAGIGLSFIATSADNKTTLTINDDLNMQNLTVQCHATAEDAKTIENSAAKNVDVRNVLFTGHRHEPAGGVSCTGQYMNCEFYVGIALSHEVRCWSKGITFSNCNFTGFKGIEYRDSTFNYCTFGDKVDCVLACHGGEGSKDAATGVATGYEGVSIFNHCQMYSNDNTFTMGYALNTTLNNCYIWGEDVALYVRNECGFLANNCTFVSNTDRALLYTGHISPNWTVANVSATETIASWAYNCSFKGGDNNQADIQVPNDSALGFLNLRGCVLRQEGIFGFDPDTSLEDVNGARNFLHITPLDSVFKYTFVVEDTDQIVPFSTSTNMGWIDAQGDDGAGNDASVEISLGRVMTSGEFVPDGMILTVNNDTVGESITLLEGNNSGVYTLTISGGDVVLATNEIAMFQFKSSWQQIR